MKKLFSILLCFILLLTPFSGIPAQAETMPRLIVGDANCDGSIDAKDALDVLVATVIKLASPSDPYRLFYYSAIRICGDVNNDEYMSADDALMILQYAVGKRSSFIRTDFQTSWPWYSLTWPGDRP